MGLVVFRADGGPPIGAGHVMRCLSLAGIFSAGGWSVGFAASAETVASVSAIRSGEHEVLELKSASEEGEPAALSRRWPQGADLLVVDHYGRNRVFESACRPWARRILVIDDLADRAHDADVLTDPANSAARYANLVPEKCKILTGPEYAIVHSRFLAARERALGRRDGRPIRRILVSFGQVDPPDATSRVLAALQKSGFDGEVHVALGSAAPHLERVRAAAGGRVHLHLDVEDMAELMSDADLAIGAGGVSSWERCCLGLPSIVICIAENQQSIISLLARSAACIDIGALDEQVEKRIVDVLKLMLSDEQYRRQIAGSASALVDGRGGERILRA